MKRQFRFASVLLAIVLTGMLISFGALLYLSFEGTEETLKQELDVTRKHDTKLINRLISFNAQNAMQQSELMASKYDIRSSLKSGDLLTAMMLVSEFLNAKNRSVIDAIVLDIDGRNPILLNNHSSKRPSLPLKTITATDAKEYSWQTAFIKKQGKEYDLFQYKQPIFDRENNSIVGHLYIFVLLDDHSKILAELMDVTNASAVVISRGQQVFTISKETTIDTEEILKGDYENSFAVLENGTSYRHSIDFAGQHYYLHFYKLDSFSKILSQSYKKYLWLSLCIVFIIGLSVVLLIRKLTERSLKNLTQFASKAASESATGDYTNELFIEFSEVGEHIQNMRGQIRTQADQIEAIFHNSFNFLYLKDMNFNYLNVNNNFANMINTDIKDIIGKNDFDFYKDEQAEVVRASDQAVLDTLKPIQAEYVLEIKSGLKHFVAHKFPVFDNTGKIYGVGGITTDITDKVEADKEAEITKTVFETASEAILIINPTGTLLTNSAFTDITGFAKEDARTFLDNIVTKYPDLKATIKREGKWQGEISQKKRDGSNLPMWLSVNSTSLKEDKTAFVAIFSDISDLKEAEQKLEKLAHYDSLTQLPNRALFYQRFEAAISNANIHNNKLALLFIDIDRFKQINDNFGHHIGDQMLIASAERIQTHILPGDTLSRLGGDEFTVVMNNIKDRDQVKAIAARIQQELKKPLNIKDKELLTSASIGIALYPEDGDNIHSLLKHSDTAMYQVKQKGRNGIVFFDQALNAKVEENYQLEADLKEAIKNETLYLAYQPRFQIASNGIVSAEALVRWQHPTKGFISPADFIPLAESTGLIVELGKQVLNEACMAAVRWNKDGLKPVSVSVNLSTRQLHDPDLFKDIETALTLSSLPPALLELEITETMVIEDIETVIKRLELIRSLGVRFAVDDFGTGYSSLIYLKRLPVSTVKIDRSFIDDVPGTSDGENLIKAIISMSHSLNLQVVAEGVENTEQLEFLQNNLCDEVQGFLLAKPDSEERISQFMTQPH